jgi:biopolymer transport protein ExbB
LETTTYGLIQLFADGGFMMYPLLLASLIGLGCHHREARTSCGSARRDARKVLLQVEGLAREGKLGEALTLCENTPGPVPAILLSGLRQDPREDRPGRDVEKAMASTGTIELGFLERGLVVLATVATVAPLMGFLGTVWGMIAAFGAIESAGQVEATLVAAGIKIALLTTAAGLLIAIPINIAYNYFVTRIDQLIVDMEEGTTTVLNLMWDMRPDADKAAVGQRPAASATQRRRTTAPAARARADRLRHAGYHRAGQGYPEQPGTPQAHLR